MKTAVGAPAPRPSSDEILERLASMSLSEFLEFQKKLRMDIEMKKRRKLS